MVSGGCADTGVVCVVCGNDDVGAFALVVTVEDDPGIKVELVVEKAVVAAWLLHAARPDSKAAAVSITKIRCISFFNYRFLALIIVSSGWQLLLISFNAKSSAKTPDKPCLRSV